MTRYLDDRYLPFSVFVPGRVANDGATRLWIDTMADATLATEVKVVMDKGRPAGVQAVVPARDADGAIDAMRWLIDRVSEVSRIRLDLDQDAARAVVSRIFSVVGSAAPSEVASTPRGHLALA